jgi:hypothetical protein
MVASPASAQLGERPSGSTATQGDPPKDLSGFSIKNKRVRMIHSTDNTLEGTSKYFQDRDPWLGYQRGKNLTQREFRSHDGSFPNTATFGGALVDGFTPKIVANDQVSCAGCHNFPYREAGAGTNFAKTGGEGRNSPHFFGGGLMEMIAIQIRQKMLQQMDSNQDGWVAVGEMNGATVTVQPATGAPPIPFGVNADNNTDGKPDLNRIFEVWYVDSAGKRIPSATSLNSIDVAGYNFWPVFWGWGEFANGLNPTNRVFIHDPFFTHTGLPSFDPTSNLDPDGDGLTGISNAGAQQVYSHPSPEKGLSYKVVNGVTVCVDDRDKDGCFEEITQGDIDIVEWYMLNAPPPARGRQTPQTQRGRQVFEEVGCNQCHVPNWYIEPANPGAANPHERYAGDRRFFHVDVAYSTSTERLEGDLVELYDVVDGVYEPHRGGFMVTGLFTDFRHHDMGEGLEQHQFDGSLIRQWRTSPLWGVGSSGPWDHDGSSFDLHSSILRHESPGSAANPSIQAFRAASPMDQDALVAWMHSLVLYQVETLPCDIDGDGAISENHMVAGKNVGTERLNAEFLFNTPVDIEGAASGADGTPLVSYAVGNIDEAYGQDLEWIADSDNDSWPDKMDEAPLSPGYLDGVRNVAAEFAADLNDDGIINGEDMLIFQSIWYEGAAKTGAPKATAEVGGEEVIVNENGLAGSDTE